MIIDSLGVDVDLIPALSLLNSLKGNERIGLKLLAITTAKRVILRY